MGLSRFASFDHINTQYACLRRTRHPSVLPNDPEAPSRFTRVVEAYATLRDQDKRTAYNAKYPDHGLQKHHLAKKALQKRPPSKRELVAELDYLRQQHEFNEDALRSGQIVLRMTERTLKEFMESGYSTDILLDTIKERREAYERKFLALLEADHQTVQIKRELFRRACDHDTTTEDRVDGELGFREEMERFEFASSAYWRWFTGFNEAFDAWLEGARKEK